MNQVLDAAKTRKLVLQTLSGAVVGALVTYFALKIGGGAADFEDPARLARFFFDQVPRTTCPLWKSITSPLPKKSVSGTRFPPGSR